MRSTDDRIGVLLVEDHPMMADALVFRLEQGGRMHVLGVATTQPQSVDLYRRHVPDLVLCDVRLRDNLSGIDVVRALTSEWPAARVVMFTASEEAAIAQAALDAGAVGFVRKSASANELFDCLDAVLAGERDVFDRATASVLWRAARSGPDPDRPSDDPGFTRREREIIVLMAAEGITATADIARRLFISANTVRAHMNRIFTKLDVNSRARVVRFAFANGLVER